MKKTNTNGASGHIAASQRPPRLNPFRRLLWRVPLGWQLSTLYALLLVITLTLIGSLVYSQQESFLVKDIGQRLEQEARRIAELPQGPSHTDGGQFDPGGHPDQG